MVVVTAAKIFVLTGKTNLHRERVIRKKRERADSPHPSTTPESSQVARRSATAKLPRGGVVKSPAVHVENDDETIVTVRMEI